MLGPRQESLVWFATGRKYAVSFHILAPSGRRQGFRERNRISLCQSCRPGNNALINYSPAVILVRGALKMGIVTICFDILKHHLFCMA
jgi:hypothetical protein